MSRLTVPKTYKLYIGGKFPRSESGRTYEIVSAKGAGMWAVGVTHTYTAAQLRQSGADAIVDGLETFTPAWIDRHFSSDPHAGW